MSIAELTTWFSIDTAIAEEYTVASLFLPEKSLIWRL